jgi:hypothetical protein
VIALHNEPAEAPTILQPNVDGVMVHHEPFADAAG